MGHKIELTREIAATPETVFRALTDADELSRWWTTSAQSDARKGGAFDYRWEFNEGAGREDHRQSGTYTAVVPDERIAYPWKAAEADTKVDFTLTPDGEGTTLRLVHTGFGDGGGSAESVEMHEQGWGFFLENLKSYLERGEDRRSEMGLKTPAAARA
jgi:uncharacterized protein YndB with AHSA1/START domain